MKEQKYIVEINNRSMVAGSLDQCMKLLALIGEMQPVEEKYLSIEGASYAVYPVDAGVEVKRVSGRYRWAESKEAAEELNRPTSKKASHEPEMVAVAPEDDL